MFNKEFDDWFKGEMPNTYKGVGKEKLESFVYDTAMAAWQARVPEGYVVVPKEPTQDQLEYGYRCGSKDAATIYRVMVVAESEK